LLEIEIIQLAEYVEFLNAVFSQLSAGPRGTINTLNFFTAPSLSLAINFSKFVILLLFDWHNLTPLFNLGDSDVIGGWSGESKKRRPFNDRVKTWNDFSQHPFSYIGGVASG